jgi:hypothetical protein
MRYARLFSVSGSILGAGMLVIFLTNPIACSSSNPSRVIDGGTQIAVSNLGKNVTLNAGVTTEIVVIKDKFDIDQFGGPITNLEINLFEHLEAITLTNPVVPKGSGSIDPGGPVRAKISGSTMVIRVARFEDSETVCSTGEQYGPYSIELNDDFSASSVSPPTATATRQTLDIINTGGYSICIQVTPVVDATADLDFVAVDIGNCDEPPADIAGTWSGTYSCVSDVSSSCDETGMVELTIVQDGSDPGKASYSDDGGAMYEGRVCGNRFSFQGGVSSSYTESGTFILNGDGSASKSSSFKDIGPSPLCSAKCTDSLSRL